MSLTILERYFGVVVIEYLIFFYCEIYRYLSPYKALEILSYLSPYSP